MQNILVSQGYNTVLRWPNGTEFALPLHRISNIQTRCLQYPEGCQFRQSSLHEVKLWAQIYFSSWLTNKGTSKRMLELSLFHGWCRSFEEVGRYLRCWFVMGQFILCRNWKSQVETYSQMTAAIHMWIPHPSSDDSLWNDSSKKIQLYHPPRWLVVVGATRKPAPQPKWRIYWNVTLIPS